MSSSEAMKIRIAVLLFPFAMAACGESPGGGSAAGGTGGAAAASTGGTAAGTSAGGSAAAGAGAGGVMSTGGSSGAAGSGAGAANGGSGAGGDGTTGGIGGMLGGTGGMPGGMGGTSGDAGGMAGGGVGGMVPDLDGHFRNWPAGADPATIGRRVAQVFIAENPAEAKHYKVACAWYGSLWMSALLNEQTMITSLVTRYDSYENSWSTLLAGQGHVDQNVFGIVPLEISMHATDAIYRQEGLAIADHQQANINTQKRFAIDDMFMITALQVQAYRVSNDAKYLDLAASTMVEYLNRLQQTDGMFHHHEDFEHKWARGNGWFAAGMAELMRELPQGHRNYAAVRTGYERMMAGLLGYQLTSGTGTGLWKQIVDSNDSRNWAETSGSAMFTYALVSGVRAGWLDPNTYGPSARAGWLALVAKINAQGRLQDISDWAYKPESHAGGPTYAGDEENYYFERPKLVGDNHGQAPVLWSAAALLQPRT
jgi:unsaturated rhamnogalacturonyl hydrolase